MKNLILYVFLSFFVTEILFAQDQGVVLVEIDQVDEDGETDLTRAIKRNDQSLFDKTISSGANLNTPNGTGNPPLIVAIGTKNSDMALQLVQKGALVNAKNIGGNSAFYLAIENNLMELAKELSTRGADPNEGQPINRAVETQNMDAISFLAEVGADLQPGIELAAHKNNAVVFKSLIDKGVKLKGTSVFQTAMNNNNKEIAIMALNNGFPEKEALEQALNSSNREFIRIALDHGADADDVIDFAVSRNDLDLFGHLMSSYDANATSALKKANESGRINFIEIALENGARADVLIEEAVKNGNQRLVEMLLEFDGDADKVLDLAVNDQNIALSELAIKNGADATRDKLLSTAVSKENIVLARLLIDNGAKASGKGLVETAVNDKNLEMTKLLVENGGNADEGIDRAVKSKMDEFALLLLKHGADGGKKGLIESAAERGNDPLVEALLDRGASPSDGLADAIKEDHVSTARMLIDAGAVIHDPEFLANTLQGKKTEMTALLLKKNAPVSYTSRKSETLLHIACEMENTDAVRELIQRGLSVNQPDNDGETPLHSAVRSGGDNLDIVKLLLDNGADINATNKKGQTVLKRARGKKVKKYLIMQGAIEE